MLQFGRGVGIYGAQEKKTTKGCLPQFGQWHIQWLDGHRKRGLKRLETSWSTDPIHSERGRRTPVVRRLPPLPTRQGRVFEPIGKLHSRDIDCNPRAVIRSPPLPIWGSVGCTRAHSATSKAQRKGDWGPDGSFSNPTERRWRPGPRWAARENAAAHQVPRPLAVSPSALSKNTYSRATQGGSSSGRRASRWRLQSSRSPRQRQGTGHRRSRVTPWPLPSAGPVHPSTAHSSNPSAAAGARSLRVPIAVLRPLGRPCAPQPAALGTRCKLPGDSGCSRAPAPVWAPFSRTPRLTPFFYSQRGSLFMPRSSVRETKQADCCRVAVPEPSARQRPFCPQKKLFHRLAAAERQLRARRSRGAGRVVTRAPPLASQARVARNHVTITGLQARGGAHEKVELRL